MNWAAIGNTWVSVNDGACYDIFYDDRFDLYFVKARKRVGLMEFRLYIGTFLSVEEAMQRAELFHENPSKYPPKIFFEPKLAKGNGAEVKNALEDLRAELSEQDMKAIDEALQERGIGVQLVLDPAVPEGVVMVQRDVITDLAGNRKPGAWIKKIADPEKHVREIRGDENE